MNKINNINNTEKDIVYKLGSLTFIWNEAKGDTNQIKHGISFEEAATVIADPYTRYFIDEDDTDIETRYIAIGYSIKHRLLLVCHCLRDNDSVYRLISARKADRSERSVYESR